MIIKSMSRASTSFKQLINYLDKDNSVKKYSWNMYANTDKNKELINEFMQNSKHLANSRWKVFLYHEVISLEDENLDDKKAQEILFELAWKYIEKRAKNHLVFWACHLDTKKPHIHLVISSNEVEWKKRVRFSKRDFSLIQQELEEYKNKHFKELEQSNIYTKSEKLEKTKQVEQEIKHKRKKATKKELIKEDLQQIFFRSMSQKALDNAFKLAWYELYINWNTLWVTFEGKKYRLKTLGLEIEYKQTLQRVNTLEAKKEKWQEFKNSKIKRRKTQREL